MAKKILHSTGPCATTRRNFLGTAAMAGTVLAAPRAFSRTVDRGAVALVVDPADPISQSAPAQWALDRFKQVLTANGYRIVPVARISSAPMHALCIVVDSMSGAPEAFKVEHRTIEERPALMVRGADGRGVIYALSDLADRIAATPTSDLASVEPVSGEPANRVRSVMRQFTSEFYDKTWFYDRQGWIAYLDMLASHRFNRVHLAFGQAYDNLRHVEDGYFLFAYPFLVDVPGYGVRANNISAEERAWNLDTIRFVSEAAVERGIDFQIGFWMHGYSYGPGSGAKHRIEGLTPQNHAPYCRDALAEVLHACPAVDSVSLRTHGESGVPEGSYGFWNTVFDGVTRAGRPIEIDLHAKGLDTRMIDLALAKGMPVNVAPKFSSEHMGLPYQEASIRDLEMPKAGVTGEGLMTLSEGTRIATRSSYADFLKEGRKYSIRYRVYPGTQRLLLWGDPAFAGAYSRAFQFEASQGGDVMEPLTYRGRRGTAVPGNRTGYVDARLEPKWDWQKYSYWYRVWGRKLYDPQAPAEMFDREFGADSRGLALATGLASASRILPTVTSAYLPSVACSTYSPELYWNQPIVTEPKGEPYPDTPSPKTAVYASALDPEIFASCHEYAAELLGGQRNGKYSPAEVAQWLEKHAAGAEYSLRKVGHGPMPTHWRRAWIDIEMQILAGRFFAAKLRAAALYAVFDQSGDRRAGKAALEAYRTARAFWSNLAERAHGVYANDLSFSDMVTERGSWQDRLPLIDSDIAEMEHVVSGASYGEDAAVAYAIASVLKPTPRTPIPAAHTPPPAYVPGRPLPLVLAIDEPAMKVVIHYRNLDQAERYRSLEMRCEGNSYRVDLPGDHLSNEYPLQYYFEVTSSQVVTKLYPPLTLLSGFTKNPFYIVHPV